MLVNRLKNAIEIGKQNFDLRESNIRKIIGLVEEANKAILDISDNKAELVAGKVDGTYHIQVWLNGGEKPLPKIYIGKNTIRIQAVNNLEVYTEISPLIISEDGFPCTIFLSGDEYVARDIETLEVYFENLLSSYKAIEALKKIDALQ